LEVGLGAGWVRADYEQSGIAFEPAPRRIARLEETIDILKQLFDQGTCTFADKHFTIVDHALAALPDVIDTMSIGAVR
jgi:alkanesulfonate monooxygenase SsuD/methylene tetrahydromethanopterin reductase-like flavin-dependent oxidoreductase (luciferase family)